MEHRHGGHRVGAGGIGDIVGLHPHGQIAQVQHFLQQVQGLAGALLHILGLGQLQGGVVQSKLHFPALFAPLRQLDGALAATEIAEIVLHGLPILDIVGQAEGLGRPVQRRIVLLQIAVQGIGGIALVQAVQQHL